MKIIHSYEPLTIGPQVITVYGSPGVGKTTFGITAANPLLLDFDNGAYRADGRVDTVQVADWSEVSKIPEAAVAKYDTIVVDTVGRALDALQAMVVKEDPKNSRKDGAPSMQGYGAMKTKFNAWVKQLRSLGKDVVLIAHASEEHNGDEVVERLDITGGSKQEIYKVSDVMGRLYIFNNERVFNMNPTDRGFGKNPAMIEPIKVTKGVLLADIIDKTKEKMHSMSEEQRELQTAFDDWSELVFSAEGVDGFNDLLEEGSALDGRIKAKGWAVMVSAARDAGLVFNKEAAAFVPKPVEEKVEEKADADQD